MATVIYDLEGNGEILTGFDTIEEIERVNGEREMTTTIYRTTENAHYFAKISEEWRIKLNNEIYVVKLCRKKTIRDSFSIEIGALHSFYDDMRNDVVNETFSGSRTFYDFLTFVFQGSGYGFRINGSFASQSFENFGDDYRLQLMNTGLERYGSEFEVDGDLVTFTEKIGSHRPIQLRQSYNVEDTDVTVDTMDLVTYGQAFGAPQTEGGTDYISAEYESPLAAIYGRKVLKSIRDERFSIIDNLEARLIRTIDDSYKMSMTLKYFDLDNDNVRIGDMIIAVEKNMDLKTRVRTVEIKRLYDHKLRVIDADYTLSNFEDVYEQQKRFQKATKAVADAIEGRRPFPFNAMTYLVQVIATDINNSKSEIEYPESGGIILRDPDDPNSMIRLESRGIGLSQDGGTTYIYGFTGRGMIADLLIAGTIFTQNVRIEGPSGNMYMDGDEFIARANDNPNRYARITPGNVEIEGGAFSLTRPDGYTLINNGMMNLEYAVQFTPTPFWGAGVSHEFRFMTTESTSYQDINSGRFRRDGRYLKIFVALYVQDAGNTVSLRLQGTGSDPEIYATVSETTTNPDWEVNERQIEVDFGVPNGGQTNFYVKIRSHNGGKVFARVLSARLEG